MSSTPIQPGWHLAFAAWVLATVSTLGSLFLSETMGLPPCSLCWYQRMFMFPLPFVLGAALLPYDPGGSRYGLVLSGVGAAIALWHNLLVWGIVPESAAPCSQDVSCSKVDFALFGILTIPMMSLLSFGAIIVTLLLHRRSRP